MAQEVEKLSVAPEAGGALQEETRGGITPAAVIIGSALFLALAWCLPYWSLTKTYHLGMGTYLPLEAMILVLLLMAFNRFGGKAIMTAGVIGTVLFTPYWHGAVYAKASTAPKLLHPFSEWLYANFAGLIDKGEQSQWTPVYLVIGGALAAFAAGALPTWLVSVVIPGLRRKMVWRELLVVFVLIAVGTYSCRAIQFVVGTMAAPYKDDNRNLAYHRFYRPVPVDQDPENLGGIPSNIVPYDPSQFDSSKATRDTPEGREMRDKAEKEKQALDYYRKGIDKFLPEVGKVEQLLIDADAVKAWVAGAGLSADAAAKLAEPVDQARQALLAVADAKAAAAAVTALQKAVDGVQAEKLKADTAAGQPQAPPPATEGSKEAREDAKARAERERKFREPYHDQARVIVARIRAGEKESFLGRWKVPLTWWMSLLAMVIFLQVFLAVMLRRQWTDYEKLMFPHAEVVRELAEGSDLSAKSRRVFASPLLWIGVGVSVVIFLLQGLNHYYPSVPAPNLQKINLNTLISERPWTAMQRDLNLQPYLLGISYLLTSEVSLSIWVFGIFNQALRVVASAQGIPRDDAWALHGEMANSDSLYTGAMLLFVGWLAWSGRRHIWYVVRRGLGMLPPDASERREPMGYRTAFWGFWLCLAGILFWCVLVGVKLWIMAFFFGLYLVLVVLISRLVAEAGLLTAGAGFWPFYPQFVFGWIFGFGQGAAGKMIAYKDGFLGAGGSAGLVPVSLRAASIWSMIWPGMLHTIPITPLLLTSFKLTETEPRRKRLLTWVMTGALVVGAAIFLMVTLDVAFDKGAQNVDLFNGKNTPNWVFSNWLMRDLVNKQRMWSYDLARITYMISGGAVMAGLLVLRSVFYWWPLHPIGMVAVNVDGIWFCFLVGWLLKRLALAYGGGEFSQKVNSFFYGLIIGQFAMAAFWALVGLGGTGCMPPLLPGTDIG